MTDLELARHEILEAHVAIERWFAGSAATADLAALMARFSEDFCMISPIGALFAKADVRALFDRLYATRPGFRITIDDVRLHGASTDSLLATYREDQSDATGNRTSRRSSAVIEKGSAG